jgi:hypothetical protein
LKRDKTKLEEDLFFIAFRQGRNFAEVTINLKFPAVLIAQE